jgi:hypothetical protein
MIFQKPEKIYTALICVAQTCTHLKWHEFKNLANFTNEWFSTDNNPFFNDLNGLKRLV